MHPLPARINEGVHDLDRRHLDGHALATQERTFLRAQARESRRAVNVPLIVSLVVICFVVGLCMLCFAVGAHQAMSLS